MKGNYLNLLDRRIRNIFNKLARSAAAAAAHRSLSLLFAALTHTQSRWMEVHSGVSEEEEVLPLCNPSWCSPLSARQQSAVVLISMLMASLAKLWKNIPMWGFRDTWIKTIYTHLANKAHVKMLLTKQKHRHKHTWFLFCLSVYVYVVYLKPRFSSMTLFRTVLTIVPLVVSFSNAQTCFWPNSILTFYQMSQKLTPCHLLTHTLVPAGVLHT